MNLAQATQALRDFPIGGEVYRVRALRAGEWGQLHQWLEDHAVDPFTRAVRQIARTKALQAPITQEQEDYLLSEARQESRNWPPRATSMAWFELLGDTKGGDLEFLGACLRTGRPGLSDAEVEAIGERMDEREANSLILVAMGRDASPKAQAPPPPSPKRTRRRRPGPTGTTGL